MVYLLTTCHTNFDFNRFQYLQNIVFKNEKDSNGRNHYSPDSHHLIKKILSSKLSPHWVEFPLPLTAIWKVLGIYWLIFER